MMIFHGNVGQNSEFELRKSSKIAFNGMEISTRPERPAPYRQHLTLRTITQHAIFNDETRWIMYTKASRLVGVDSFVDC